MVVKLLTSFNGGFKDFFNVGIFPPKQVRNLLPIRAYLYSRSVVSIFWGANFWSNRNLGGNGEFAKFNILSNLCFFSYFGMGRKKQKNESVVKKKYCFSTHPTVCLKETSKNMLGRTSNFCCEQKNVTGKSVCLGLVIPTHPT